jgi:hypothetical protein
VTPATPRFRRTPGNNAAMPALNSFSVALLGALLVPTLAHAAAQKPAPLGDTLVPHRAVYSITLARTDPGSAFRAPKAAWCFEITGGECSGYNMRQRMVVNIGDEQGNLGLLDFRIATFESGDGHHYRFDSKTSLNKNTIEAVKGEARRGPDGIEVKLETPAEKTIQIGGETLFPSQHLQAILNAASSDKKFMAAEIYEGAGTGDSSDAATAAIGKELRAGGEGPLREGLRRWPVSVGYFGGNPEPKTAMSERTPTYQMRFNLYENGVTNQLVMDYGNYALSGSLEDIQPLEGSGCPSR